MGLKVSAVRDFSIELVNELGHWLIFAVDELSMTIPDRRPERIGGPEPSPEEAFLLVQEGFDIARAHALEHRLVSPTSTAAPRVAPSANFATPIENIDAC